MDFGGSKYPTPIPPPFAGGPWEARGGVDVAGIGQHGVRRAGGRRGGRAGGRMGFGRRSVTPRL